MKETFSLFGMSCASCAQKIERTVASLEGVKNVNVNLLKKNMSVEYSEEIINRGEIVKSVRDAGYDASSHLGEKGGEEKEVSEEKDLKKRLILSALFTVPLFFISMSHMIPSASLTFFHNNPLSLSLTEFLLTIPVVFLNFQYFQSGFSSLVRRSPNMNSLVAIGSSSAVLYGIIMLYSISSSLSGGNNHSAAAAAMDLYFESAAMILTLITLGKYLEEKAKRKTSFLIEKLINLSPKNAVVRRNGEEIEINPENLLKGDTAIVRSGSQLPSDGIVTKGCGSVDESFMTGESIPVEKKEGDRVTGATILLSGYLEIKIDKIGEETTLSKIIALVDEATSSKAPIAKLADKVSSVFVPIVILLSLLTLFLWLFFSYPFSFCLTRAISVLLISCPCALGLATPTAIMVGSGKGAEMGILFKNAEALENMNNIGSVVFDKTGTITEGKAEVVKIIENDSSLLAFAYSVEKLSIHPFAKSIVSYAEKEEVGLKESFSFKETPGMGVSAIIDGFLIEGGNRNLLIKNNLYTYEITEIEKEFAQSGITPLFFLKDKTLLGAIGLCDKLKETSKEAFKKLKEMNIKTFILTGDNEGVARAIQREVGSDEVFAEVMPDEKERIIKSIKEKGVKLAMVGDGINDSPSLVSADVGIAIGAGSDIAIEAADVVLVKNDPLDAVAAIKLGKATIRNIKQNLLWALLYNTLCIPIAGGVLYPSFKITLSPMIAAFCMSFSSVFVVSNALRLRLFKIDKDKEEKMTVFIKGMMCDHCSLIVKNALSQVPGAKSVDVSLKEKSAEIEGKVEEGDVIKAIEGAGYEVVKIES